jgi:hypothetical protein
MGNHFSEDEIQFRKQSTWRYPYQLDQETVDKDVCRMAKKVDTSTQFALVIYNHLKEMLVVDCCQEIREVVDEN